MNVLFVLNGPTGNRGCEAILLSTYDLMKSAYPSALFVNCSERDERVSKNSYLQLLNLRHECHPKTLSLNGLRWQLAKRARGDEYNFERFVDGSDIVFSLGGDNYSLDYGCAGRYFRANQRILESGGRLVIWGASIGPFSADPELEALASAQLRGVHRIVVRESRSRDYLSRLGVIGNVVLMPDPAFSLDAEPVELPREIEEMLVSGAVGVNLSPLLARYRHSPESWIEEAAHWVEAVCRVAGAPVVLIPHVMQPGNDDAAFMHEVLVRAQAAPSRLALLPANDLSSRQLKHIISRLRAFVGARTHATIAALSTSVPTLSIGYSVKALGINEDVFGHDRWVVSHLELDSERLAAKVCELLAEEDQIRGELAVRNRYYRMDPLALRAALA